MSEGEDDGAIAPKRRGRPPGKRGTFSFRVTPTLRAQLEAAAAAEGRPISEVIENRLEQSFWADAAKAHDKDEAERFSADAYLKRIEGLAGGPEGLDFSLGLGDLIYRLRKKLGLAPEPRIRDLPDDQRRTLLSEFTAAVPAQFLVWDPPAEK